MTDQHDNKPNRMTLSAVVERLTERRGASSSVTVKMSAQGVFMPEVTVAAGCTDEEVDLMVEQAVRAFTELYTRASLREAPSEAVKPRRAAKAA